jgi:hypothetical protein
MSQKKSTVEPFQVSLSTAKTEDKTPIIPSAPARETRHGCPRCQSTDFGGRNVQGCITFTCRSCQNQWQGGLPKIQLDPRMPNPPENPNDIPPVTFRMSRGVLVEDRRPVSLTQNFRKGAPIPSPGEEDV